jgi:hypothetical protein
MGEKYIKDGKLYEKINDFVGDREIGTIKGDRVETKGFFTPTLYIERDWMGNIDLTETDSLSHLLSGTREITRLSPDDHPLASESSYINTELTQEYGGRKVPKSSESSEEKAPASSAGSSSSDYSGGGYSSPSRDSSSHSGKQAPSISSGVSRSDSASGSSSGLGGLGLLLAVVFLVSIFSSSEAKVKSIEKKIPLGDFERQERRRKKIDEFKKMFTLEGLLEFPEIRKIVHLTKEILRPSWSLATLLLWIACFTIDRPSPYSDEGFWFYMSSLLIILWFLISKIISITPESDGDIERNKMLKKRTGDAKK